MNKSSLSGYAIPGDLYLGGNTQMFVNLQGDNQIAPTSKWTWNGTGGWQEVKLFGHNQTVAGLSDATGHGAVENTWDESGYGAATLTINTAAGTARSRAALRDTSSGSCGALSLVKTGTGTQTLIGGNISYTGGTTINGGTLVLQDVTNTGFTSRPVTNNGVLEIDRGRVPSFAFNGAISGTGSLNVARQQQVDLGRQQRQHLYGGDDDFRPERSSWRRPPATRFPATSRSPTAAPTWWCRTPTSSSRPAAVGHLLRQFASGGFRQQRDRRRHFRRRASSRTPRRRRRSRPTARWSVNSAAGSSSRTAATSATTPAAAARLALVKNGGGTLTLTGSYVGQYTGGLTVNAGTAQLQRRRHARHCRTAITRSTAAC